ncbi:Sodium/calcium exchanger regulatory protein 1 [Lamellibrachia satsuma]|nr:Sodium/calcium exchanger regulatory protein 1 [Lamellibrachia satsuma]
MQLPGQKALTLIAQNCNIAASGLACSVCCLDMLIWGSTICCGRDLETDTPERVRRAINTRYDVGLSREDRVSPVPHCLRPVSLRDWRQSSLGRQRSHTANRLSPVSLLAASTKMASKFVGKWKLESTENFDEYMKAVGVGMVLRKLASVAKPSTEITVDGDNWNLKTLSTVKNTEISFKLGEPFDETTGDGRNVKTTMSLEADNKLIQTQVGEPCTVITRELTDDDTISMTLVVGDVTCKRMYKRDQ